MTNSSELKGLKEQLFQMDLEYRTLPPKERGLKAIDYMEKRAEIKHKIGMILFEERNEELCERIDEDDKYKRR